MTIEPGTRFATEALAGRIVIPDGDSAADLFEATRADTAAAGLPAYETSNHARPGSESRHNLAYWRYQDYAGIGPGAHGRRGGLATVRRKKPENWLAAIERLSAFHPKVLVSGHGAYSTDAAADLPLTKDYLTLLRKSMREAVEQGTDFEEAYKATDWSRFSALPAFSEANHKNAFDAYLNAERESLNSAAK